MAVVAILAVSGIVFVVGRLSTDDKTSGPSNQADPIKKTGVIEDRNDIRQVCGPQGVGLSNATAYPSGEPPHLYAVIRQQENPDAYTIIETFKDADMRRVLTQPQDIQLVGCLTRINEAKTEHSCRAGENGTAYIYTTDYRLDIYTAKTRKLLKTAQLGNEGVGPCPLAGYGEGRTVVFTAPDNNRLRELMNTYILP